MFKQTVSSKIVILGLALTLALLGNLKFKQWISQKEIEKNINNLKKQLNERERKNYELSQSLSYLKSADFKEKVAREQLGYKKSGENVYGFSENNNQAQILDDSSTKEESNPHKWWNYFFSEHFNSNEKNF